MGKKWVRLWQGGGKGKGVLEARLPSARCARELARCAWGTEVDAITAAAGAHSALRDEPISIRWSAKMIRLGSYFFRLEEKLCFNMSGGFRNMLFGYPLVFLSNVKFVFGSTHYLDFLNWVERIEHRLT